MSWDLIEIGEFLLKRNGSIDPSKFLDETFELHSIPSFDKKEPEILTGRDIGSSKQIFQENDVMISKIVPHIRRAMVVPKKGKHRQIASGEWIVFRSEKIYPNYLRHLLISDFFNAQFMATVSGVGGSLLRARPAFVSKIQIPLSSLPKQKRIADILDKADDLRHKRQQSIAKLDELLQATFIDMFGDPVTNLKGWELKDAKQLLKIQGGFAFASDDFTNVGIPVVKIGNANKLRFYTKKFDFIQPKEKEIEKLKNYELRAGDLLISLTGTVGKDDYGNISEVTNDYPLYYLNQRVAKIDIIGHSLEKQFIKFFFTQKSVKSLITKNNRGVRQANISNADIFALKIPIPSMNLQERFSKIASQIEYQKNLLTQQLTQQNQLFQSLQQQAFNGTL